MLAAFAALGLLVLGVLRLQFSADIFGLLPKELPVINALATYQKGFKREQELLLTLEAKSAFNAESAAGELAAALLDEGVAAQVIWQNPAEQDNDVLSELLALQWLNVAPAKMQALAARFETDQIEAALQTALLASYEADDPFEAAIELSDPFGVAKLSADSSLESNSSLVASPNGKFRVLYLTPPAKQGSAEQGQLGQGSEGQDLAGWALQIKTWVAAWQQDYPDLQIGFAGTPVFNQEFSDSLVRDMQAAVLGTLLLVGLLFFWAHRRLLPLLWLVTLLGVVLATTVAIGGQLFGTLNVISLGYAAVLMGLAADYGLLLYQAHRSSQQAVAKTIKQVAPSILWAGLTTSVAFLMVGRGSLPGMTQLGVLVAVGIVVAALVMIGLYLWPLQQSASTATQPARVITARSAWMSSAAMLLLAVGVLAWRLPAIDTDPDTLGPGQVVASQVQDEIELQLERDSEALFVLFSADHPAAVQQAMQATDQVLASALNKGWLASYSLPNWWPNAVAQAENKPRMLEIAGRWPDIVAVAEAMGYPVDFMTVTENALAQFSAVASRDGIGLPALAGSAWLFGQTAAINTSPQDELPGYFAVGQLSMSEASSKQQRADLLAAINDVPHAQLSGWPLASAGLLDAMQGDLFAVALPMLVVLLVVLFLAYRGVGEILFSLMSIALTLLALMAVMVLMGWQWNLMNILALPLLVGVTVDYSIHTQLALQRFNGDLAQVYQHVGRAIALAGATTAIGFGSLAWANNEGLASLGQVASTGVVLACAISVLLQPHWWRALHRRTTAQH